MQIKKCSATSMMHQRIGDGGRFQHARRVLAFPPPRPAPPIKALIPNPQTRPVLPSFLALWNPVMMLKSMEIRSEHPRILCALTRIPPRPLPLCGMQYDVYAYIYFTRCTSFFSSFRSTLFGHPRACRHQPLCAGLSLLTLMTSAHPYPICLATSTRTEPYVVSALLLATVGSCQTA